MSTQPSPSHETMDLGRFAHSTYLLRKNILEFIGKSIYAYDDAGQVVFFSHLKGFKLKEDIRVYAGPDKQRELLTITARQIIDFSASYDVVDAVTGEKVGALRRRGMKSLLRDHWIILDEHDREIGEVQEDSLWSALVRRFVELAALLLPQSYSVTLDGQRVATFKQNFNPFVNKLAVDFRDDPQMQLDRRLGLAAAVLMLAIEGRQS